MCGRNEIKQEGSKLIRHAILSHARRPTHPPPQHSSQQSHLSAGLVSFAPPLTAQPIVQPHGHSHRAYRTMPHTPVRLLQTLASQGSTSQIYSPGPVPMAQQPQYSMPNSRPAPAAPGGYFTPPYDRAGSPVAAGSPMYSRSPSQPYYGSQPPPPVYAPYSPQPHPYSTASIDGQMVFSSNPQTPPPRR